jgi:hypothetical protein
MGVLPTVILLPSYETVSVVGMSDSTITVARADGHHETYPLDRYDRAAKTLDTAQGDARIDTMIDLTAVMCGLGAYIGAALSGDDAYIAAMDRGAREMVVRAHMALNRLREEGR